MAFESITLEEDVRIDRVVTIHYFEYMNNFYFPGEQHDFWEFQCVDKGEVRVRAGEQVHTLKRGQVIFHKPNEFHNLEATGKTAPNVVVVSFECDSPCLKLFRDRILDTTEQERSLIAMIIAEARKCIALPLDDPYLEKMEKREEPFFGSQQLIRLYLEQLLIYMIRRNFLNQYKVSVSREKLSKGMSLNYSHILMYLEDHIRENLKVEDICRDNLIGRSQLQRIFRENHQCGVIEFFTGMKVDAAKQMIRESEFNFTQISEYLGYSSIHYFSRQFKKVSGMTPTEYLSSIKALSER